jgi:hypothetical protein
VIKVIGLPERWAMKSSHRVLTIGACCFAFFFYRTAAADDGEAILEVYCDPDFGVFEVEPRIEWHIDLDAALQLKEGEVWEGRSAQLRGPKGNSLLARCRLPGAQLRVSVENWYGPEPTLELFVGENKISKMKIGDVWSGDYLDWGAVFRARYENLNWVEQCKSARNSSETWLPLDRGRADTNCR